MSDTTPPSPAPANPATPAPKLTLTPKPLAPVAVPLSAPTPAPTPPPLANTDATPTEFVAPKPSLAPKPAFKLQNNDAAAAKFAAASVNNFSNPMPKIDAPVDTVSPILTALSGLAAAAAITFAVLLFLKNQ